MQHVHIKNIEDYHPGYKDRTLIWAKIYFRFATHPKYKSIPEIDKWRLVSFIILELMLQEPVPLDMEYLRGLGWDFKKRPISLTLQMLHRFIEVRNGDNEKTVPHIRVYTKEKSRVDKDKVSTAIFGIFWNAYPRKHAKSRAEEWFQKNNPTEEHLKQMLYLIRQQSSKGGRLYWVGERREFVPLATTWLNDGDWRDAPCVDLVEPQKAAEVQERIKEEIRDDEKQYYQQKTIEELEELLKDPKMTHRSWLFQEIIAEKKAAYE